MRCVRCVETGGNYRRRGGMQEVAVPRHRSLLAYSAAGEVDWDDHWFLVEAMTHFDWETCQHAVGTLGMPLARWDRQGGRQLFGQGLDNIVTAADRSIPERMAMYELCRELYDRHHPRGDIVVGHAGLCGLLDQRQPQMVLWLLTRNELAAGPVSRVIEDTFARHRGMSGADGEMWDLWKAGYLHPEAALREMHRRHGYTEASTQEVTP